MRPATVPRADACEHQDEVQDIVAVGKTKSEKKEATTTEKATDPICSSLKGSHDGGETSGLEQRLV